jgi:hypothetical protein
MLENGRGERRRIESIAQVFGVNLRSDKLHAIFLMSRICVECPCFFKSKTNVLSAAWDARPVYKFIRDVL